MENIYELFPGDLIWVYDNTPIASTYNERDRIVKSWDMQIGKEVPGIALSVLKPNLLNWQELIYVYVLFPAAIGWTLKSRVEEL